MSNTLRLTLVDAPTLLPFLGLSAGMPPEAAAFTGALVSGLLASLAEIKLTYPRIALTVPSIVIMVPGLYLYRSMYYMCTFDTVNMLGWFVRAVLIVAFLPLAWAWRVHSPTSLAPHQLIGASETDPHNMNVDNLPFLACLRAQNGDYPRSWNGCPKIHARWADADAPGDSFFVDVVARLRAGKVPTVNIYSIWVKRPKRCRGAALCV